MDFRVDPSAQHKTCMRNRHHQGQTALAPACPTAARILELALGQARRHLRGAALEPGNIFAGAFLPICGLARPPIEFPRALVGWRLDGSDMTCMTAAWETEGGIFARAVSSVLCSVRWHRCQTRDPTAA